MRNGEAWARYHWENPPSAFNPDFRPGYGKALSKAYAEWCEKHPDSTQDDRKRAHRELAEALESDFPKVRAVAVGKPRSSK